MILNTLAKMLTETRSFKDADVDDADLMALLEAAHLAPSAMNSQIWRFFVVRTSERLDRLAKLAEKPAFLTAPVIIAACASPYFLKRRGREQPYFMIDVPIAVSHLLLAAVERGLGCAWTYEFDELEACRIIGAPQRHRAVALVALGHIEERNEDADLSDHPIFEIR